MSEDVCLLISFVMLFVIAIASACHLDWKDRQRKAGL